MATTTKTTTETTSDRMSVNALLVVPGLFLDTTATIRVISAVTIVATVAAVVLTMRRSDTPSRVVD